MSGALRKGWCPGALRPMAAGDGLIVRVRPSGGILPAPTAQRIADLAENSGNARLDLSSRANLQIRGVTGSTLPSLLEGLGALGLVDADAPSEAVRNVIASPGAGLHHGLDIRPLVVALERRLTGTRDLHALPGKFGWVVDDGSTPSLAEVPADVRFTWRGSGFAIALGGTRATALLAGSCRADEVVDAAESIARGALALFARHPEALRMRTLIQAFGAEAVLAACCPDRADTPDMAPDDDAGTSVSAAELHAPYGRLSADMLRVAATLAADAGGELRLTPWRSILLPGVAETAAAGPAARAGWITAPDDPRLSIAACVGSPDCARATTATRSDADVLSTAVARWGAGLALHVSGCVKGCAHAGTAAVTLVARDGRYDLVLGGRASDPAARRGLDLAQALAAMAAARTA